jgi:23S rRNA (pseudouridine1915-N3)-methyltransferase
LNIKVVLEGKLKESFYKTGANEYQKRLFNRVEVVEVSNILNYIENKQNAFIITMEIEGKQLSSTEFASKLKEIEQDGCYNEILFLIGGAEGHLETTRNKADLILSFGKLTLPHILMRAVLTEQIYRIETIINHHPYHKY